MGKREVDIMKPRHLDIRPESGKIQWNSYKNENSADRKKSHDDMNFANAKRELSLPPNMELFSHQVAGHMQDGINLGLIRSNNKIYKPIVKEACGRREIGLYEQLKTSKDPVLLELKKYVPKYHGTEVLTVDGRPVKYIVLDDITRGFREPCVMDIKIGRRTYDPLASYDKIIKEDQKYHETKRDLGFCIPGFQVFKISTGRICKYGKDYGKSLNKETVIDALKIFLNANTGTNRTLIMHILTLLWCIQNWARKQRHVRLFSSSLLIVYDAKRLRQNTNKHLNEEDNVPKTKPVLQRFHSLNRPLSIAINDKSEPSRTSFSGLLTQDGPILGGPASPTRIKQFSPILERKAGPPSLRRMHSFQNNYDKDLQSMKTDYVDILDQLVNSKQNPMWATVKLIDFAHVFPVENCEPDTNFMEGVNNLVKIFEAFLVETDPSLNNNTVKSANGNVR